MLVFDDDLMALRGESVFTVYRPTYKINKNNIKYTRNLVCKNYLKYIQQHVSNTFILLKLLVKNKACNKQIPSSNECQLNTIVYNILNLIFY